jgi:hypothetical protein
VNVEEVIIRSQRWPDPDALELDQNLHGVIPGGSDDREVGNYFHDRVQSVNVGFDVVLHHLFEYFFQNTPFLVCSFLNLAHCADDVIVSGHIWYKTGLCNSNFQNIISVTEN